MFVLGWAVFFMLAIYGWKPCRKLFMFVIPPLLAWSWLYDFFYFYFKIEVDFQGYPHYAVYGIVFIVTGLLVAYELKRPSIRIHFIIPELVLPILLIPYDMFLLPWFWRLATDWEKILARVFIHPVYMVRFSAVLCLLFLPLFI